MVAFSGLPPTVHDSSAVPAAAPVKESMLMPNTSTTGTVLSVVKTTAAVMVLALLASVAGFVTPDGTYPADAQEPVCTTATNTIDGVSAIETDCSTLEAGTIVFVGDLPTGHVWCRTTFGPYFTGSTLNDPDAIAFHRTWVTIGILTGVEYVPEGCGVRSTVDLATLDHCVVSQVPKWRFDGEGDFEKMTEDVTGVKPRLLVFPSGTVCYGNLDINSENPLKAVIDLVCDNVIPVPEYVEFFTDQRLSSAPFDPDPNPQIARLDGDVFDFDDCCPNPRQHNDGIPGGDCHNHTIPDCLADEAVTVDIINGDDHWTYHVPACPDTTAGATFDIVLDYPRRAEGEFAIIGGELQPITFTGTAKNFVCRGECGNYRTPLPLSVSFDLDLIGLDGYTEGSGSSTDPTVNFIEFDETYTKGSGVRWGQLNYNREIVAYFYRATFPEQRVAFVVTAATGRYRYWERTTTYQCTEDTEEVCGPVTTTTLKTGTMTARLYDVAGNLITSDVDYRRGRIELKIAGAQLD